MAETRNGGTRARGARRKGPPTLRPAPEAPVARVAVDIPLAHLDRPFDYLVPERLAADAMPGVRIRVRFAGQLTDGFILERAEASEHGGRLSWLDRVVSPERVLTPEIAGLARAIADRYGGTLADVLRLAVPPRHAATEAAQATQATEAAQATQATEAAQATQATEAAQATQATEAAQAAQGAEAAPRGQPAPPGDAPGHAEAAGPPGSVAAPDPGPWRRYPAGESFLTAVAQGRPVRAAWTALPGDTWPEEIALASLAALSAGRGTLIVVPDARDLARVDMALDTALGSVRGGAHVTLTAELGPAERYRRWLSVLRGEVMVVAGTRAAMFAPVSNLGLVVLWDEGDDLHAEPRAPYPNAREVLALRAHQAKAAALIGGFARTAELAQLVESGWARSLEPQRATIRATAPLVRAAADEFELARDAAATTARLPSLALRTVRAGLAAGGPVLVQVPRRGYLVAIACGRCRGRARCTPCGGPLQVAAAQETPSCGWCGALAGDWKCPQCDFGKVRAITIGAARTAEELGRAFPGVKVRTSGGPAVLATVPDEPALVIATPGGEPLARYAAALLLDGWALLARPSLRSDEEALRRWMNAAALVRADGAVIIHADAAHPAVQALIRWDATTFSERTLADRIALSFPPAVRMAAVTGEPDAVASLLAALPPPPPGAGLDILGPVPVSEEPGHGGDRGTGGRPQPGRQEARGPAGDRSQPGRREARGPAVLAGSPGEGGDRGVSPPVPGVDRGSSPGGIQRALLRVPRAEGLALARALHAAQAARSARKEGGGVRVQLDPAELI